MTPKTLTRALYSIALLAMGAVTDAAFGFDGKHQPLGCGFPWYGGSYQPREIRDTNSLPAEIRLPLARHIATRVGPGFLDDVTFERGQIVDIKELHRVHPDSKNYKWRVPTYNLIYQLRLPGREIFRACILLDGDGGIIQELTLPDWGHAERPAPLISLADATKIATTQGISKLDGKAELEYFPDTDTLEWLFSTRTSDDGLQFEGKTLHVPLQSPSGTHWSTYIGIR